MIIITLILVAIVAFSAGLVCGAQVTTKALNGLAMREICGDLFAIEVEEMLGKNT